MAKLSKNLKESNRILKEMNVSAVEFQSTVNAIQEGLKKVAKEEQSVGDLIDIAKKNNRKLKTAADALAKIKKEELKTEKGKQKFLRAQAKFQGLQNKNAAVQEAIQKRIVNATDSEAISLAKISKAQKDIEESAEETAKNFKEINEATEKINKSGKIFQNISNALGTIPGVGPLIAKPFQRAAAAAKDATAKGKSFATSLAAGGAQAVSLTGIFGMLMKTLFSADSRVTNLAKTLQMSKEEASIVNDEFTNIGVSSGKAFFNAKNLSEATAQLSKHLGVANRLNTDLVKNQTFLTKQVGVSEGSAGKIAGLTKLQGKNAKDVNKEIATSVGNLKKETGIAVNLNDVFEDVANANAGLKAAYGFNTKLLAEQVVKSKQLGLSLEQSANMANSLLNFEESIENELSAELLTGKNLNLERARGLALEGKSVEAATELANQIGGTAELSRMNVIQQEALAKAMGMERNELIESVQKREILSKLGADSLEQLEEEGRLQELSGTELGEQILKQYEQTSAAEKFQAAVVKIQEAFGAMMEGPLGSVINGLATAASSAGTLYTVMGALGAMSLGRLLAQLGAAVAANSASAAAALTTASAITFGLGLIAILTAVGVGLATMNSEADKTAKKMTKVGDLGIKPNGGPVVMSAKEGAIFQGSKNDGVEMSPTAGNPNRGGGADMTETNTLLQQLIDLVSAGGTVTLDGQKVGETLRLGAFETN